MRSSRASLAIPFVLFVACGGTIGGGEPGDSGPDDGAPDDSGGEGCESMTCAPGQECVDGRCVDDDCCADVVCQNEGEICRDCVCIAGGADDDGDGFPAREDCDDHDPALVPGSTRPCASDCGAPGLEVCAGGAWVDCNAPLSCDCTPGTSEEVPCGRCGRSHRSCGADGTWGGTSDCVDEGECMAGTTEEQGCGLCGTESRTCDESCSWGAYGACTDEGPCTPESTESRWCGRCGLETRTCGDDCEWGSHGTCAEGAALRTAWQRVNAEGNRMMECAEGVVLAVGSREVDGDWHLDDMALECCGHVPVDTGACTWTSFRSVAAEGEALFECGSGSAMVAIESHEFAGDAIVDSLRVRCCPTEASTTTCTWTSWLSVAARGTAWHSCPDGQVATALETREFGGDWLVDHFRVRCCS